MHSSWSQYFALCEALNGEEIDDICLKMTDSNFQQYCYDNFDSDNNYMVSKAEAAVVTEITCSTAEDFTGIEYFTGLQTFTSTSAAGTLDLSNSTNLSAIYLQFSPVESVNLANTNVTLSMSTVSLIVKVFLP